MYKKKEKKGEKQQQQLGFNTSLKPSPLVRKKKLSIIQEYKTLSFSQTLNKHAVVSTERI